MAKTEAEQLADEIFDASKLLRRGNRAEALAIYHDAEGRAGADGKLQYQLGRLCEEFGDYELAVSHYRRAVDGDADNILFLGALGAAQVNSGDTEQALETLRRAEAVDPGNLEVLWGLGFYYLGIGDNDKAVEYLRAALDKKPGNAMIRVNLSIALSNLNRHDEALEHARKAVKSDASSPEAMQTVCNILAEIGRLDEAEALLQKNLRKHPGFGKSWDLLARIRKFSAADDRIVRQAEKALDRGMAAESRWHLCFALGKMHDDCRRYEEAFSHYRQANLLARKDFDVSAFVKRMKSLRSVFTADLVKQCRRSGSDSAQPVFIVGMPRSGTTLMEQMIASHPRADSAGELTDMAEISDRIFAPQSRAPSAAQLQSALVDDAGSEIAASYLRNLGEGREDAARIVDKAPVNFQFIGLIATLFPNATVIHAMRNPLDTCLSCYFQNFAQLGWSNDFESLATVYCGYRETMDYWKKTLPQVEILDLSYEQLVEEPEPQARRMIEACGLDWDESVLEYSARQSVIKTASQAQARQPVYRSSRSRWRHYAAHIGELASLLAAYLDDADREFLAERGIKLDRRAAGGWLKRLFN
jgi:tetratricopeptide (TPR) repeat protein